MYVADLQPVRTVRVCFVGSPESPLETYTHNRPRLDNESRFWPDEIDRWNGTNVQERIATDTKLKLIKNKNVI